MARYHIKECTWDSFLLNQSKHYVLSMSFSIVEFWVLNPLREAYMFAIPKDALDIMFKIGLAMILIGQAFRTFAQFTAAKSFHHQIQDEKA